jgi:CRP-like cAMP-binding protein/predicted MFS family arabinose efflux permease
MSQATVLVRPSPFTVFRNPAFARLWTAQLVSTIGDSFTAIAAGILVYQRTGSTLQVGLTLMATSVPILLIGVIAGVFVDRYDRKRIMVASSFVRAVLVLFIPILIPYSLVWLFVILILSSAIGTFFTPAYDSVIPEVASDEELAAANSMIAISSFGSTAVGFAASGLIAAYSIDWAFYIDALTFLITGLLLLNIKVAHIKVEEDTSVAIVVRNLKSGLKYLFNNQVLRSLLFVGLGYGLVVGMGNTLLLPFATNVLGASTFEYGLQEGLTSIGFVIGSLLMAKYSIRLRDGLWAILGLMGMGICYFIYSFSTTVTVAIAIITLAGVMNAPWGVVRRTMVQRNTEREIRGRVMGAFMTINHVMILIGMAAAGLADLYGARLMMQTTAVFNLAVGVFAMLAPGIGRPAADWLRSVSLLRRAAHAPGLEMGRAATLADMDRLIGRLPALATISLQDRQSLLKEVRYIEAPEGTSIVRQGEDSDAAYFILDGGAVAGREEDGGERILEVLGPGDFFGEIAALTGVTRTANIITDRPSVLLRVPAAALREITKNQELNRLLISKMTERMIRMDMIDLPKKIQYNQQVLRELRTAEPESG